MPTFLDDSLPAALASRLTAEQRQLVDEAPRATRLAALAAALGLTEADALTALAEASGLDIALNLETDPGARGLVPARLVHDYQVIAISKHLAASAAEAAPEVTAATPIHFASAWLPDSTMDDWIRTFTPRPIVWHLAVPERIHQLIIENFGVGSHSLEDSDDDGYVAPEAQHQAEEVVDEDAAVVRFVSDVISQAMDDEATDIHFEPQEGQLRIRYRVDGLLVPVPLPENLLRFQDAIISRVKIMARLNISERRLPQDGRINFKAGSTTLDIRVSTIPTIYAESISLRLLNKKKEAYSMEQLGMSADGAGPDRQRARFPARDHPGHRADRLGQEHLAQRLSAQDQLDRPAHHHDRGSDRIRGPGRQPDAGAAGNRPDLRRRAPPRAAPGSRRHHGRRNPRPRHRRNRDPRLADRPLGVFHPAHQRRPRRHHPLDRHGHRALPGRFGHRTGDRPAPGPPAVPGVRQARDGQQDQAAGVARHPGMQSGGGRSSSPRSNSPSAATGAATPATAAASAFSKSSGSATKSTNWCSSAKAPARSPIARANTACAPWARAAGKKSKPATPRWTKSCGW